MSACLCVFFFLINQSSIANPESIGWHEQIKIVTKDPKSEQIRIKLKKLNNGPFGKKSEFETTKSVDEFLRNDGATVRLRLETKNHEPGPGLILSLKTPETHTIKPIQDRFTKINAIILSKLGDGADESTNILDFSEVFALKDFSL